MHAHSRAIGQAEAGINSDAGVPTRPFSRVRVAPWHVLYSQISSFYRAGGRKTALAGHYCTLFSSQKISVGPESLTALVYVNKGQMNYLLCPNGSCGWMELFFFFFFSESRYSLHPIQNYPEFLETSLLPSLLGQQAPIPGCGRHGLVCPFTQTFSCQSFKRRLFPRPAPCLPVHHPLPLVHVWRPHEG